MLALSRCVTAESKPDDLGAEEGPGADSAIRPAPSLRDAYLQRPFGLLVVHALFRNRFPVPLLSQKRSGLLR